MTDFDSRIAAQRMKDILGLETEPVAVFLLGPDDARADGTFTRVRGHRFCQLVMRARRGESVLLTADELACPAAAAAFGLRPLPPGLASGKGLVGFGIVAEPGTGRTMFEGMPHLEPGRISAIAAAPLATARALPDVIVVEGRPEALMWLVLADLNVAGGARRLADTAVLQATCVDATVIPFLDGRLNFSLGCYGCREATDLGPDESVLGFPAASLEALVGALERLAGKAVARSRAKVAFGNLQRGEPELLAEPLKERGRR
jgi:uncharacterized protein (DUF169 family)